MENRKIINATICEQDDILFRSKLEKSIYNYLKSINLDVHYECHKFVIWDSDKFTIPFYDKYGKVFKKIDRKPTSIHYTPDFIFEYKGIKVILEVKGFKNDVTNYKVRLFREYLEKHYSNTNEKVCYAIVYSIRNLKYLLEDLDKSN